MRLMNFLMITVIVMVEVGSTRDFAVRRRETEGPDVMVRVFTPGGERPEEGWPVMVYYHGGGWVL